MLKRLLFFCLSLLAVATARAGEDVIEIWTVGQLTALRDDVNAGTSNYSGKTVRLMTDLSLTDWTAIGTTDDDAHSFSGVFDGQGYSIHFNDVSASATVLSLFGYFRGTVCHLKVTGRLVNTNTATTSTTAGIVAYNRGTVSECANLATVIGTTAGGIAGENLGTIGHCYSTGYIGTSDDAAHCYLGGIAGVCESGSQTTSVYASCTIEYVDAAGGIAANRKDGAELTNGFYDVKLYDGYSETAMDGSTTLTGHALESSFGNDCWTFSDSQLPELACFTNQILRLGNNTDNSALISANSGRTCTVELSGRTLFKDNSWNTLCLPFSLTEEQMADSPLDGATVKELSSAAYDAADDVLTLNFSSVSSMEAGKPYLIRWADGDDVENPRFSSVTVQDIDEAGRTVQHAKVSFVGTFAPVAIGNAGDNLFLGSANTLHYPNSAAYTVKTFRAYFHLDGYDTSASRSFILTFVDDPSAQGETTALDHRCAKGPRPSSPHRFLLNGLSRKSMPAHGIVVEQQPDGSYRKAVVSRASQ